MQIDIVYENCMYFIHFQQYVTTCINMNLYQAYAYMRIIVQTLKFRATAQTQLSSHELSCASQKSAMLSAEHVREETKGRRAPRSRVSGPST